MAENLNTDIGVQDVITEAISGVNRNDLDLDDLTKLLCADRLSHLEDRAKDEFSQLRNRQLRIRLLHNLIRTITSNSDTKGNFDFSKIQESIAAAMEQLKDQVNDLLTKLPEDLQSELNEKYASSERITLNDIREHLKVSKNSTWQSAFENVEQDIAEVEDVMRSLEGVKDNKGKLKTGTYNKEERDRWVEILRTTSDDLTMLHQMQVQVVNRLNNERNETLLMARTIMKTLHEDKLSKARAIAGR